MKWLFLGIAIIAIESNIFSLYAIDWQDLEANEKFTSSIIDVRNQLPKREWLIAALMSDLVSFATSCGLPIIEIVLARNFDNSQIIVHVLLILLLLTFGSFLIACLRIAPLLLKFQLLTKKSLGLKLIYSAWDLIELLLWSYVIWLAL